MVRNSVNWNLHPPSGSKHAKQKPMMVTEWGAIEGTSSNDRPAFLSGVPDALRQPDNAVIKAVSYWNELGSNDDGDTCDFRLDQASQTASAAAFAKAGKDSWVSLMPA
jgi:hypothetical protein